MSKRRRKPNVDELREYVRTRDFKDVEWQKVRAPKTWYPEAGDELIGYYTGQTLRDGMHGQYTVVQVMVPGDGVFAISGTMVVALVDASGVEEGAPIRIVFRGWKLLEDEDETVAPRKKKMFDVYVDKAV